MSTPFSTKLGFAASGIAQGLISNGLSFFLLLYYNQALGLDAALAGLALMIALVIDAISDPLIGRWSDRMRHAKGRRHPFIIASIVPISLAYYFLWDPPALTDFWLFAYLTIMIVTVRLTLTAHTVPFNALTPEIAPDYEERTGLMNYSYSASWFLGTIMAVAMYAIWLADTPEYPNGMGILRPEGYVEAGLVTAIGVFICLTWSCLATTKYIPQLSAPPAKAESFSAMIQETLITVSDRNFFAIAVAGVFSAAASGTATALWAYMQPYFWGFNSEQISTILAAQLFSSILAFLFLPLVSRGKEKKPILIFLSLLSIVVSTGPVLLSLLGAFPARGTNELFYTMVATGIIQVMLIVMTSTITASILSDIVDARAVETKRREEGLLFSLQSFIGKVSSGMGIWAAGITLAIINFPTGAAAAEVDPTAINSLGWLYAPLLGILYLVSIFALSYYQLDRSTHSANIELLKEQM